MTLVDDYDVMLSLVFSVGVGVGWELRHRCHPRRNIDGGWRRGHPQIWGVLFQYARREALVWVIYVYASIWMCVCVGLCLNVFTRVKIVRSCGANEQQRMDRIFGVSVRRNWRVWRWLREKGGMKWCEIFSTLGGCARWSIAFAFAL